MPQNKTLYIKDEDVAVWDESREYFRDTLTAFLTEQLKTAIAAKKAQKHGFERIVLQFQENGLPRILAFQGRWLVSPQRPHRVDSDDPFSASVLYAVAITPKENIAVFKFGRICSSSEDVESLEGYIMDWGKLLVFPSFEVANQNTPDELIAKAMEAYGVEIEELDI